MRVAGSKRSPGRRCSVCYAARPMRKHLRQPPAPAATRSPYLRAASIVLCAGIIAVSTAISPGTLDSFRLPKEIAFRAEAILFAGLAVFAATTANGRWRELVSGITRPEIILCVAIGVWTIITTTLSTNRLLSVQSTITVFAAIVFYLGTRRLAAGTSWLLVDCCFLAAALNALLIDLQEYGVWNPFRFPAWMRGHVSSTALIGHPDDVGVFLVAPTVAAAMGVYMLRGKRRWAYAVIAAVLLTGLVASAARAALIAVAAAAVAFALNRPWKQSLPILAALIAIVGLMFGTSAMLRKRFTSLVAAGRNRQYNELFSERLVPFLSAVDMIRSHPLTGVGPGCFKYHYMDERLALAHRYPASWTKSWPQNFAETHNDHLQVTAETGLPGYVLLLAAILLVGREMRARSGDDGIVRDRRTFAGRLRLPLATAFFVVALAQFPLQIAAPRAMFLTFAAIVMAWDPAHA